MTPLEKAVEMFRSQAAFARALGVVPMTVSQWKVRGIPADWCPHIERVTDGRVTRAELRPDLFGEEAVAAKEPLLRRATDVRPPGDHDGK